MFNHDTPLRLQLAIQGGGAKICCLIAALEAIEGLEKNKKIEVTRIAGTSAGAIVGALYAARVPMADVRAYLKNLPLNKVIPRRTKIGMLLSTLRGREIWQTGTIQYQLEELFKKSQLKPSKFNQLKVPMYVTATNIKTSSMDTYSEDKEIINALLDSCALPFVFRAVRSGGDSVILDGGICESLPSDLLQKHIKDDGSIVGISFKKKSGRKPEGLLEFCIALLDSAINNSMERARRNLETIHEIDTNISTFDFQDAFSLGLGEAYEKIRIETKNFFDDFLDEHRLRQKQASEKREKIIGDPWEAASTGDHWAQQYTKLMSNIAQMYHVQYEAQKIKYLHGSVVVKALSLARSSMADEVISKFTFKPKDGPLYCHNVRLSHGTGYDMHLKNSQFEVRKETDNGKIKITTLPMHIDESPHERPLLLVFDPVLLPEDGTFTLIWKDTVKGFMKPLEETGKDELFTVAARSDEIVNRIDLVLYLPNTEKYKNARMVEKANSEHPGRAMKTNELGKYEEHAPHEFRTLGWIGENVPAGYKFAVDIYNQ